MRTKRWLVTDPTTVQGMKDLHEAAKLIKAGELVAFPTETVYGLGANALDGQAVAKIFTAKGRPQDNPLIVHVANVEQLKDLVKDVPDYVYKLIAEFSPGPVTYILPAAEQIPQEVTAGLATVGIRIPDHSVAHRFLNQVAFPVAAPSANTSGKPSPTSANHVYEDLSGKISGIIDGGKVGVGLESTVIDCTGSIPVILRPGVVTAGMLANCLQEDIADFISSEGESTPRAPGMKYRHYAPEMSLVLVGNGPARVQAVIDEANEAGKRVTLFARKALLEKVSDIDTICLSDDLADIARNLYDYLRMFTSTERDLLLFEEMPKEGIGIALMNRLEKAAVTENE